jgi:carbamoyl-phosphate synthase large subunit
MGLGNNWGAAYAKSQMAASPALPQKGKIFISVRDSDKQEIVPIALEFAALGFQICATAGTARLLTERGLSVQILLKLSEGRPNCLDLIKNGEIQLVVNTPAGKTPRVDEVKIRTSAVAHRVPIMTTLGGAKAAALGIAAIRKKGISVRTIQEYHAGLKH